MGTAIGIVVLINVLGLAWCYGMQSDKVTDLIYSLSFILLTSVLWWSHDNSLVHHLILVMITLWGGRLGGYLFIRILTKGKDERFNQMRKQFFRIAGFWSLQTGSILILAIPIFILFSYTNIKTSGIHYLGLGVWSIGWFIETISDWQKFRFKTNPSNKGKVIQHGLWKVVQHPNYLGEILCWIGVFLVVLPVLQGWQWIAIVSPLWIITLLVFISGIPLLQKQSAQKYGHLDMYRKYTSNTPLLIPFVW